ncbi:hypothetical protein [Ensifer sp. LBL]|uniref:hypothetical protein n=1 Tax=Ensifer sp. LBL TaxID=2991056 RepID=UPI003D1B0226
MAQRAIERGVGGNRKNATRVEISAAVAAFVERGGAVRRFEAGVSGDYDGVKIFLAARGYDLSTYRHAYRLKTLGQKGPGKVMHWSKVIALVDEIRVAENREPLRRKVA